MGINGDIITNFMQSTCSEIGVIMGVQFVDGLPPEIGDDDVVRNESPRQ